MAAPRRLARIAGLACLSSVVAGVSSEFALHGGMRLGAMLVAVACYLTLTVCLYVLLKPVNAALSLVAAACTLGVVTLGVLRWHPLGVDAGLVFFGLYCLVVGYLIARSTFLPNAMGAVMVFAGLAWLTYLSPALGRQLHPYNMAGGALGLIALCLWLLVFGVNARRWEEQARGAGSSP